MSPIVFALTGPAGAAGAVVRYGADRWLLGRGVPVGLSIALVNIVASALMGLLVGLTGGAGVAWTFLAGGFLGGLSTFSTAMVDACRIARTHPWRAGLLLAATFFVSLTAFVLVRFLAAAV